ncbi:hypothetical protein HQ865_18535 [Mucilaginibacter mali]|uniref:Uncharacterized protein n=1 Tax=Mucilaginibacter mali TaxID=2740462 RepID=A0A7D4UGE5_9SPHI|nr:DUF5990 family protein [Mucilaginibacter mali]QKJ31676.1 hypothetical protein HQ865_18535 [Mucilaginibacter mali]
MHLIFHITLKTPPAGILYALQKGSGSSYHVEQAQHSSGGDLHFEVPVEIKGNKPANEVPDFKGPYVHGPLGGRFIYLDIGNYAGEASFLASGRIKVPLTGITWAMVDGASALETTVAGTGKNGGPAYATPKPFAGWKVKA